MQRQHLQERSAQPQFQNTPPRQQPDLYASRTSMFREDLDRRQQQDQLSLTLLIRKTKQLLTIILFFNTKKSKSKN